jgi:hypothetical protein
MTSSNTVPRLLQAFVLAAGLCALLAPATPALAASSWEWSSGSKIVGSGKVQKQTRELDHFTALALSMHGSVELRLGNTERVTVETDDNMQGEIETVVENGTLRIRPVKKNVNLSPTTLHLIVEAKNIDKLTIGGSGSITAAALRGADLTCDIGGSGSIDIEKLDNTQVRVSIGGSGRFHAGGGASENLNVSIGGSGRVDTGRLGARRVEISIGGSGQAVVWARQSLNVNVAGSGGVDYYGDPDSLMKSLSGSGKVRRIGAAP